jgi:delta 1-pyrroline-5-carboxylate dehydrogenase
MNTVAEKGAIKTITTHYIDGAFVESHGQEVMDIIRPTDGRVIASVRLADEEDTRRAIGAARRAFATFGRTTKEERATLYAGCIRPSQRASMTSRQRWSRSTEALCSSPGPSWRRE